MNSIWAEVGPTLAQQEKYRLFLEKQSSPPGYISSHPSSIKTCVVGVFRKFGCFSRDDASDRLSIFLYLSEKITSCQPRWISTFITKNDHVSTKFNITFKKNLRFAENCIVELSLAIRDQLSTLTSYGNYHDVIFLVCMLQTRDREVPRA